MPAETKPKVFRPKALGEHALDQLFRTARSFSYWLAKPISDETLHRLYDLMKWGPTSLNGCPARVLFLRTAEAKERLVPALAQNNVEKVRTAPVTAIVGYDLHFYDQLPKLYPHLAEFRSVFSEDPELARITALRNSSLQGAYLMIAARGLGLDCGPMSGFDNAKVDEEFFGSGQKAGFALSHVKSNFLCNLGYGDRSKLHPRNPRLSFEESCALL